jgi:hypothetical protein
LFGRDPYVPLAGWVGGPAAGRHNGHDAAYNERLPRPAAPAYDADRSQ